MVFILLRGKYYQSPRLLLLTLLITWHIQCRASPLEENYSSVSAPNKSTLPINISVPKSTNKLPHKLILWGDSLLDKLSVVYSVYSGQNVNVSVNDSSKINDDEAQLPSGVNDNDINEEAKQVSSWSSILEDVEDDDDKDHEENAELHLLALKSNNISGIIEGKANYPGELGSGITIEDASEQQLKNITEGYEKFGFNEFVSNLIPHNRSLPDFRNEWCQKGSQTYSKDLPTASIIIAFHNEAKSTLLRTLYSILERSDEDLMKEILLVNDFSSEENFDTTWLENVLPNDKIRIINTLQKEGVARARTLGAMNAKSSIIIFLDSHVEVTEGWLEPLLHRIALFEKAIVAPSIEVIDANTFRFKASTSNATKTGIFDWSLEVKRKSTRISSPGAPVQSAVIPFGMFAIHNAFFKSLGYFDTEFTKWGGEALELSFKAWMCGGRIEVNPCSHVGHVFKGEQPDEHKTSMKENLRRVAVNWLGEHAPFYYEMASLSDDDINREIGSKQSQIKLNLKCQPFSWYLENIAPEVFNPDLSVGEGEIRSAAFGSYFCIDASSGSDAVNIRAGIWPCHQLGGNQYWHYSSLGELRRLELCLDYSSTSTVIMYYCNRHSKTQKWLYDHNAQQLYHPSTSTCLTINAYSELALEACNSAAPTQKWTFGSLNEDRLQETLKTGFNITDSMK
ncbi:unnamed protein product [Orchesella dallaii]|uniref:Polypeptide N-acetylgalactosaminyltransferase n=1 Tax=Orchesella dallaii TaxID=48710 RepID=A0ABP1PNL5_9HEXA